MCLTINQLISALGVVVIVAAAAAAEAEAEAIVAMAEANEMKEEKSPHAYYMVHNYSAKKTDFVREIVVYEGEGLPTQPSAAPNTITIFAKTYGEEAKPGEWGFSPKPTGYLYSRDGKYNWVEVTTTTKQEDKHQASQSSPAPEDYFLFVHFFTPAVRRPEDRGPYERAILQMRKEENEAKEGKKVLSQVDDDKPPREEHLLAFHLPSKKGLKPVLSEEVYQGVVLEAVSLIWKKDLAQFQPDWIDASKSLRKNAFDERLAEWEAKLKDWKSSVQQPKPRFRDRLAAAFSGKKLTVEKLVKSDMFRERDPLQPEILCDVDLATARKMEKGEWPPPPPTNPAPVSTKRRTSGRCDLLGRMFERAEKKTEPPRPHIFVERRFYEKGDFGHVFKMYMRPDTDEDITPGHPSGLYKYKAEGKPGLYGPFAIKYILVGDETLQDDERMNKILNEAVISRAFDHPNLSRTLYICRPSRNRLAIISEFASGGELFNAVEEMDPLIFDESNIARPHGELTRYALGESALALSELHNLGLVHNDVKMENVLWGGELASFRPHPQSHFLLSDFGSLTREGEGEIVSTFPSPERKKKWDLKPRHTEDMWGFGVMTYAMVMRKHQTYKASHDFGIQSGWEGQKAFVDVKTIAQKLLVKLDGDSEKRGKVGDLFTADYFNKPIERYLELLALGVVRVPIYRKHREWIEDGKPKKKQVETHYCDNWFTDECKVVRRAVPRN